MQRFTRHGKEIVDGWTDEQIDLLKRVYETATKDEMENYFPNKHLHAVGERARKLGLHKKVQNNRYGNVSRLLDESLETYYWIGFIFADGYIHHKGHQIVVCLINDKDHLEEYAKYINCSVKSYLHKKNAFRTDDTQQHRVSIRDQKIVPQVIKKFDFKEQKTYNPPSVTQLSKVLNTKEKFLAFLCGFIDGDGCVYKNGSIKIENHASWHKIHQFFYKRLKDLDIINSINRVQINKRGFSQVSFAGSDLIRYVREFFPFVMKRKWFNPEIVLSTSFTIRRELVDNIEKLIKLNLSYKQIATALNVDYDVINRYFYHKRIKNA